MARKHGHKNEAKQGASQDDVKRHPVDQGGHAGESGGHGGQQSGGMGGMHGGDLHDAGSAQGGMTGGSGMGGNDNRQGGAGSVQEAGPAARQAADDAGYDEFAEVQQSVQRAGMGAHRPGNRGSEEAIDADEDFDDVGSHRRAAGRTGAEGPDD